MPGRLLAPLILLPLMFCSAARAATATAAFTVTATLTNGCAFGSSFSSPTTNLGTINFGSMSSIPANVDTTSVAGAGSVVVTCTPGTSVSIAMDYGTHGGSATRRFLQNTTSTEQLGYQLFQDAARSQVWGNGALVKSVASFPATTQTYPVYARLYAVTTLPSAGTYTDTVTVTLTY
ncbi:MULTISPECIES: spore coat U domain-containing protein [Rahnella]|jgi:spore coat protein U-like protein|uniref:Spore coat protein U domain-containing protein n=2 Tax=Rahnella TaxID=34037 RepID=A0A6M2B4F4_9GAMM|nr:MULTISPECIES: spore coat U domain-containing protein [Rahnella]KAB8305447.1 SCPU domain-containing protein [Rouxiella chamberiensis]MBF7979263.1 spore coat protein U domain-containing protein [Rahnella laticis]MBF7999472.1 spore coat protein U domain-containing protein [Rahnella sp. LAC-M12]MBV6821127.1 spore coat U domain-containing protein [Rahnella sp. PD12R]MCS3423820.1 spore coat protein U-like protein [Rahnella sp. BIGb0603]